VAGDPIGAVIDRRYRLKREIARGGAGIVYEAEHLYTKRAVAIKLLAPEHTRTAEHRERLLREAQALSVARHPGIVTALDAGETADGSPYLVMELLEGRTLDGILAVRGKISVPEALYVGQQLCTALAVVHGRGLLHRDIKPSNIFITRDDDGREITKLFDFGIANRPAVDRKLTQVGSLLGTPEYMAPEQLLAREDADHRCDIYALGATLYECLTGAVPYEGNFGEVLLKSSTQPLPPLRDRCPGAPAELVVAIEKALAREVAHRFASARAMLDALSRILPTTPPSSFLDVSTGNQKPAPGTSPQAPEAPRRRFARAPYVTHISIRREKEGPVDARSEDISLGGMLVIPKVLCHEAEVITVVFALPISGQLVEIRATSRWIKSARSRQAMGVEFSAIRPDAHAEIERYVQLMGANLG
jgi:serine/threonine protein kinase